MIPKDAKPKKDNHVAEGEATGHFHAIKNEPVLEYKDQLYIKGRKETILEHQEHSPITLPPLKDGYSFHRVMEYDHLEQEAMRVRD